MNSVWELIHCLLQVILVRVRLQEIQAVRCIMVQHQRILPLFSVVRIEVAWHISELICFLFAFVVDLLKLANMSENNSGHVSIICGLMIVAQRG